MRQVLVGYQGQPWALSRDEQFVRMRIRAAAAIRSPRP
jgi:hypothetical protein